MESRTVTAVLDAPAARVFSYLANIENLPRWATEFARELKLVDGRHKVVNGLGMFRWPGQSEELFESQHQSLLREFANIERELASAREPRST